MAREDGELENIHVASRLFSMERRRVVVYIITCYMEMEMASKNTLR